MHSHRPRRGSTAWPHPSIDPVVMKSILIAALLLATLTTGIALITRGLI